MGADLEEAIVDIWRDVLDLDSVASDEDYFSLGGESLGAVQMLALVEERLGVAVSFTEFVEEASTVAALAALVSAAQGQAPAPHELPGQGTPSGELPCTHAQKSLWFLESGGASGVYNEPVATRLEGELDPAALDHAFKVVVKRHASLRTTIKAVDGVPLQVIADDLDVGIERVDLRADGDAEARALQLIQKAAETPFDLDRGPLVRALLVQLADCVHLLALVFHHMICDGWSHEVALRDLSELYNARREQRDAALPDLPVQYGDYAIAQRNHLVGDVLAAERDFWRAHLAGAPTVARLPSGARRPTLQTFHGETLRTGFDADLAASVRDRCRDHRVTPYMLLLATFAALVYRLTGQDDLLVSGPMANREARFQNVIGFFANTVVVRVRLGGNPPFGTLLRRVRESVLASYGHQHVPLELVVDAVRPERNPSLSPLVQLNFRVRSSPLPKPEFAGVRATRIPVDLGVARFELALELHLLDHAIAAEWNWRTGLLDRSTIVAMSADFERLLSQGLADPRRPLLGFELNQVPSPEADRSQAAEIRGFRAIRTSS